jgi:hypothetical protein
MISIYVISGLSNTTLNSLTRFETNYLHLSGKKKRKQKVTNSEPLMAIMPAPAEA